MTPRWAYRCQIPSKTGEKLTLEEVAKKDLIDDVDMKKNWRLVAHTGSKHTVSPDLIILALSSEQSPVAIESIAREMMEAFGLKKPHPR